MKIILKVTEVTAMTGVINRINSMMFQKLKAAKLPEDIVGSLKTPEKLVYRHAVETDTYMKVFTFTKNLEEVSIEINPTFVKEFIQLSAKSISPLLDSMVSYLKFIDSTKKEADAFYDKWLSKDTKDV